MTTTVRGTLLDASSNPAYRQTVRASLVATGAIGYTSSGEVVRPVSTTTAADGTWSIALVPNDSITPANTYYMIDAGGVISLVSVPATGGPYEVGSILTAAPASMPVPYTPTVQVAAAGTVAGTRNEVNFVAGANVAVSAVDNPDAGRVDVTIAASGGGGGGGAVNTVNHISPDVSGDVELPFAAPTAQTSYGASSATGTSTSYPHADHTHGTPALSAVAPTTSAVGDAAAVGTGTTPARTDHTHGREAFGTPGSSALADTVAAGTAVTPARSDHRHGREALTAVTPTTSAVADTAAVGTGTAAAREDHKHAREAFGTPGSSALADTVSAGAATTVARSDHRHGRESLTAVTPTASALGDSGAVGTGTAAAREDHKHARESLTASAPTTSAVGDAATVGTGTSAARSDHVHGREAFATPGASAPGDTASAGAATTLARSDHRHSREAAVQVPLSLGQPGVVAVGTGPARLYNDTGSTRTIVAVRASVGTPPTGASLIVDINKNGTTIFTTQGNRPTISAAGNTSGKVTNMNVTTLADGDYVTVDVDQVGSTIAGSDLTVTVWIT